MSRTVRLVTERSLKPRTVRHGEVSCLEQADMLQRDVSNLEQSDVVI